MSQVIPHPWGEKLEAVRNYKRAMSAHAGHGNYSCYGLEGWLNAKLLVSAIERAGRPLTRQRLEAALREAPFDLGGYRVSYADDRNAGSSYVETA